MRVGWAKMHRRSCSDEENKVLIIGDRSEIFDTTRFPLPLKQVEAMQKVKELFPNMVATSHTRVVCVSV